MSAKVTWNPADTIIEIRTSSSPWSFSEVSQQLDPIYQQLGGTGRPTGVIVYLPDPPYIPMDTIRNYRTYLQHQIDEVVMAVFVAPESMMLNILYEVIARIAKQHPNYEVARTSNLDRAYEMIRGYLSQYEQAS